MNRYRYPGTIPASTNCCKPKECNPKIIKVCPPAPYIQRSACRANISDRAVVRHIPPNMACSATIKFALETFSGLVLLPMNLDKFCGYDFKDGEIVAVEAEDLSSVVCKDEMCFDAVPVKLFNIMRTWKGHIHKATGVVSVAFDPQKEDGTQGDSYYMLTETTDLTLTDPYFREVNNRLLFDKIVIRYEIFNIMGEEDSAQTMADLVGKTISVTYVDYGQETRKRIGIPIVITEFSVESA
ncbi:hypothetical protein YASMINEVIRUS_1464 [Yasminevirus sp. GU-2018]|uniref:Uncharacterized protein n=1 Tax=Yasminevirus sp. GU-2018 TaxID=2420051 RepID=A0A5K0UBC5_9VIRU|nr:hypothetical protein YASMINEVIRUS_1464 [Yasminevirus sp. GU-2018]